jgi:uncharacterized protein YkwD
MKNIRPWILSMIVLTPIIMLQSAHATLVHRIEANTADVQQAILAEVNSYRAKHHLSPLRMNPAMSREAERHSQDMATNRMPFGHQGFNQRIQRLSQEINHSASSAGSENVAAYPHRTAQEIVALWLSSPGHRRNIEGHFDLTGVGVAHDGHGRTYYTQIFLRTSQDQSPVRVSRNGWAPVRFVRRA